jgi:hypothetical protein
VGSDKHAAELTRKKVESDIVYGTYQLTSQNSKTLSLDALIDEYLKSKKHHILGQKSTGSCSRGPALPEKRFPEQDSAVLP